MENSPLELIIFAEARADAQIARELADRVCLEDEESPDWLDEDWLPYLRKWAGIEEGTDYMRWASLKQLARVRRVGPIGHRKAGGPGAIDYAQSRKAIILVERLRRDRPIRALLLIRDLDNQAERKEGMEQARAEVDEEVLKVVIGAADPMREAWVLNGFEPETKEENAALVACVLKLSFDPREQAERLRARTPGVDRNPKYVLKMLTEDSYEREQVCWLETSLDLLIKRGEKTGLRDYLEDVKARLLPLFKQP